MAYPKDTMTSSVAVSLTRAGQANNTESKEKDHHTMVFFFELLQQFRTLINVTRTIGENHRM